SGPRSGRRRCCVRVPPRLKSPPSPPKRSPRSPRSSTRKFPPLPKLKLRGSKPGRPLAVPNESYCLRFSGSESVSYAFWTSLNFSSADTSPGFLSGWYLAASLRYAFLISSADAFFLTPNVSYSVAIVLHLVNVRGGDNDARRPQ